MAPSSFQFEKVDCERVDCEKVDCERVDRNGTPFNHGRAPRRGPRMLPARAALGSIEGNFDQQSVCERRTEEGSASRVRSGRVSVRIAVPDRTIRMTEFGLRYVPDDRGGEHWWERVADQMETLVSAHLPHNAKSIEMAIDSESLEVVLEYDAPQPVHVVCG